MNVNFIDLGRFVAGLVSVGGLCLLIRFLRRRSPLEKLIQVILESGVHYGAAGVLIGYSFLPPMRLQFAESLLLATAFFGGWFGFVTGSSLDLRILRRRWPALGFLEPVQAVLLGASIFLAGYAFSRISGAESLDLQGSVILILCGICAAGKLHIGGGGGLRQTGIKHGIWPPALATFLGIVVVGLGTTLLRDVPFEIRQPFAAATRTIAVDGLAAEIFWSLVLGAVIGLVADLLIRGVDAGFLCYLLMGALMLGSGIAAVLGLEPLWIGLVAGIWLINTTLRRLDILVVVERNHGLVQAGVYLVAGWILGSGLARHQVDMGVLAWVLVLVGLLRPLVRLGFLQAVERIGGKSSLKNLDTGGLLDLDDLALIVAMSLISLLPAETGLALLGAVMAARFCLRPAGLLLQQFTPFGGRRMHSSPE